MLNKIIKLSFMFCMITTAVFSANISTRKQNNTTSNKTLDLSKYDTSGTLFQKIVDLEQQKILLKLEKEQTQMDLELQKLKADKLSFQKEQERLAKNQAQDKTKMDEERKKFENEKKKLEQEKKYIDEQKNLINKSLSDIAYKQKEIESYKNVSDTISYQEGDVSSYKIKDIMGISGNYVVVLENIQNNQRRKLSQGQSLPNGYKLIKIQPVEGIATFQKDGDIQKLSMN